jgi:fumarate reductase flavoprotein subunit
MNRDQHNTAAPDFDIIVVGGGGAGLAAAIEGAAAGSQVLLLEKEARLGGTTGRSVGSISATHTDLQRRAHIADTPQAHFEDMPLFAGALAERDNPELRRLLVENVPHTVAWLEQLGLVFFGPMPEPPHRVPRMHNVLPNSKAYIYHLSKEARRLGVTFLTDAKAIKINKTGSRVVGVDAVVAGKTQSYGARKGVILTTGDFSSGTELKNEYLRADISGIEGVNPASTGDGQRLGVQAGGEIINGDLVYGPEIRFVAPPEKKLIERLPPTTLFAKALRWSLKFVPPFLLRPFLMMFVTTFLAPSPELFKAGAILVNKRGERFADEQDKPQYAIPAQPDRVAYLIFDQNVAAKFNQWPYFISTAPGLAYAYLNDYRRNRRDIFFSAPSVEALAEKLSIPAHALKQTVVHAAQQQSVSLTGPFYALGPAKSWIVIAEGGLKVNAGLQVLDRDGQAIEGLFAAGSSGQGGLILEGHGHHLAWAFTSGRIAGRNAAR